MKITIKLGGFIFKEKPKPELTKAYAEVLTNLHREGHELAVVTGGGANARNYIHAARSLGANEALCDLLGIYASRLNAHLLIAAIGQAVHPHVPSTVEEMLGCSSSGKIVAMGGLQPAHSTDAVAAIVAEMLAADRFIKVTDTAGIYTKDPHKHPDARKLDEVRVDELLRMMSSASLSAGAYELMDPIAIRIIQRSRIRTWIIPGDDPRNIVRAVKEEKIGTRITF